MTNTTRDQTAQRERGDQSNQRDESQADLFGGNVISAYSRADALADGVLVAVAEDLAREAGFVWPVALTAAAWADCVAWTEDPSSDTSRGAGQDETGRLWDVLWMARHAVRQAAPGANRLPFSLLRVPATGTDVTAQPVTLSLLLGPGDRGEPVLTICEPGED